MKNQIYLYLSWVITFLFTPLLLAKENQQEWLTRSSKHFEIYYKAYQQTDADEILLQAERIHAATAPLFKITPTVTPIVLRDTLDITNAFATPEGHPGGSKIEMFLTPPDNVIYELSSLKDWRHDILLHEYTHILNSHALGSKIADWNSFLLEGFAVYMESKSDPTNGRLNSAYYRLIMRQEVASEHFKSWKQISIINHDWPSNKHYVYGAFFTQYLIDTYGEPAYLKFLEQAREEGLDAAELKTVYHKDFFMLWQDFEQAMRKKFAPELAAHQNLKQTPNKSLLQDQLPPLAFTQQGQLYSSYTDDRANRRLATYNLNTDTWSVVDDFPNAESIDNHPTSGMLITTLIRNDIHSSHMVLKIYQNQQWRTLPHVTHIHHARWMPDGKHIVGIQVKQMQACIVLIDPAHPQQPTELWQGSKDEALGRFAVDPTGRYLMIQHQHTGSPWNLMQFDLQNKTWTAVTDTPFTEHDPIYKDTDHVLFSADYNGIFNIYELDLKTRRLSQYTNTSGGAFAPFWDQSLGMIYRAYGTDGYELIQLAQPKPYKTSSLPLTTQEVIHHNEAPIVPTKAESASLTAAQPYSPWPSLVPKNIMPIFSGNHKDFKLGAMLLQQDILNQHEYRLITTYDLQHGYLNLMGKYRYQQEWMVEAELEHDYLDVNEPPTKNSRTDKEIRYKRLQLTKHGILSLDEGHFSTALSGWYNSETELNPLEFEDAELNTTYGITLFNHWQHITHNPIYPGSRSGFATGIASSYIYTKENKTHAGVINGYLAGAMNLTRSTNLTASIHGGYTSSEQQLFLIGGVQESNQLTSRRINLHGYANEHAQARYYAAGRLAIQQRLLHLDQSFGLKPIGTGNLFGSLFIEGAQAWLTQDQKATLASIGVSLTYELAFNSLKIPFKFSLSKGLTEDAPDSKFELEISFDLKDYM